MKTDDLSALSKQIIGAAIEVHRVLGPGLLESAYEGCLAWELDRLGMGVERQVRLPIRYKELVIDDAYRVDSIVERELIPEIKCVEELEPVHTAQLLTYLKMSGSRLGLILNFKAEVMELGIKRVVNGL
jgi:GxxExxY protein